MLRMRSHISVCGVVDAVVSARTEAAAEARA
jgi:hypothetical protein